ncbi:MAG: WHG domain-containing protein [Myxococcota bacterium]
MADKKRRIVEAASEILVEGGTLSVREIARRVGSSTMGVYSNFQGKQGVLDALYIEGFELLSRALDVGEDAGTPMEAVSQASEKYLAIADEHSGHYSLMFGGAGVDFEPSPVAKKVAARAFSKLVTLASQLLPEDASLEARQDAALRVWALLHGLASLRQHGVLDFIETADWKPRVMAALTETVLAIQNRPAQTPDAKGESHKP